MPGLKEAIHPVQVVDVARLYNIFIQSLDESYGYFSDEYRLKMLVEHSRWRLMRAVLAPRNLFYLAQHNGEAVGYNLTRIDEPGIGFIHWMYIKPDMRGHGLGKLMIETTLQKLRSKQIDKMRLLTHDKVDFYRSSGFVELRRSRDFLDGVEMSLMELKI